MLNECCLALCNKSDKFNVRTAKEKLLKAAIFRNERETAIDGELFHSHGRKQTSDEMDAHRREDICCWSTVISDPGDASVSVYLSGMIGAKSGVHLSLLSLMEELLPPPKHSLSALSLRYEGEKGERKTERDWSRSRRGSKRRQKKGSMHRVDTRLSGEFELKKDVDPGGDSYLAHILKLETFTSHRSARVGNGGV